MKRVILILTAVLCLLGGQARAEEAVPELSPELRQAAPEAAVLPVSIQYDGAEKYTVELSDAAAPYLLTGDSAVYTLGTVPENKCLPADAVGIDGSALTLAPVPGGEAAIDIPVAVSGFTNYTPLALTVRVTLTPEEGQQTPEPPPKWETPNDRPGGSGGAQGTSRPAANAPAEQDAGIKTTETVQPDGSKLVEMTGPDGTASTTTVSASGQTVTVVEISESAVAGEGAIKLPMPPVPSARDAARAPFVTVNGPEGAVVTVEIPVEKTTPGTVAVLIHEDGAREVVRKSVADNGTVTIPLDGSAKLEIVDNSKQFADVPATSWAADAVAFASAHELFNGTAPGQFSPEAPMSRGMLAVVLHNLENNPTQALTGVFADVDNGQWYAEGVSWAAAQGIIGGYGNGAFGPNDNITRAQLAVMLWRYAGSPAATDRELHFADAYKASDWAEEALRWTTERGILNGKGGGILDPTGQATRAETAQMLYNFLHKRK